VSAGSVISVMLTLALVLGVMGIALKLLRKYTVGGSTRNNAVKMEILQRLTLGQRQGLAVVRVGSRVLAVSMGDGGVHPVAELDPKDFSIVAEPETTETVVPAGMVAGASKMTESLRTLTLLRKPADVESPIDTAAETPDAVAQPQRISYVAPMEDFQAVLNMAMGGGR
jgi:flagellar biogenesis protein FliO